MELRHYVHLLRRSWPLVVGLPALVALLTVALYFLLPPPYVFTVAALVTQRPVGSPSAEQITLPNYDLFHSWGGSEYIVDDILQLVETRRFATDIADWLRAEHGIALDPERISESLDAERRHRMIYFTATAPGADEPRLIAQGAIVMLQRNGLKYWEREEATALDVAVTDIPDEAEPAQGLGGLAFDLVLRSILALMLAIGLAFLRHYLDLSLRERGDVEALGFEIVGTIPHDQLARAAQP